MFKALFPRILVSFLVILGIGLLLYPTIASWKHQWEQSKITDSAHVRINTVEPNKQAQIQAAHRYNKALASGAQLEAHQRKATGMGIVNDNTGNFGDIWEYMDILNLGSDGLMANIRIDAIGVDLPIYHTSSDEVLLKGAGHLQGTSLPVGGRGTRAVITAHRGLADATMFTNLDKAKVGDDIVIEVFGEVLVYRIIESKVVEPEDTESIQAVPERDLITLVTCTPLGINSHRILVTGERIYPTPQQAIEDSNKPSQLPHFPWWAVEITAALCLLVWWNLRGVREYRQQILA